LTAPPSGPGQVLVEVGVHGLLGRLYVCARTDLVPDTGQLRPRVLQPVEGPDMLPTPTVQTSSDVDLEPVTDCAVLQLDLANWLRHRRFSSLSDAVCIEFRCTFSLRRSDGTVKRGGDAAVEAVVR